MKTSIFLITVLAVLASCKQQSPTDSDVKFDSTIDSSIDIKKMPAETLRKICNQNPIFIFVGNGETVTAKANTDFIVFSSNLMTTIERSVADLESAIEKLPLACDTKFNDRKPPHAMLVKIIDGPGTNDSKIETNWFRKDIKHAKRNTSSMKNDYSRAWVKSKPQRWQLDEDGTLQKTTTSTREIHLPTELDVIVNQLLKQKPSGVEDFKFDQTIYLIKSHGGRLDAKQTPPTMGLYYDMVNQQEPIDERDRAFLFDSNSASGKKVADLFTLKVSPANACKKFMGFIGERKPGARVCGICRNVKAEDVRKAFSKVCQTGTAVAQGITKPKEEPLTPMEDTTLTPMEDTTLTPMEDTTLTPMEDTTLSSGKNLVFTAAPVKPEDWDEYYQLGHAVKYNSQLDTKGLHELKLPLAGDTTNPPMIFLDSCYGSTDISSGSFALADTPSPVVVVINPNPMAVAAVNYGSLNYFQYLAMPYIQARYALQGEAVPDYIATMKEDMDTHLENNGLQGMDAQNAIALTAKSQYKIQIFVTVNGRPIGYD